MTGWNGVLHAIQKALGLDVRDVSAIEAAMSISEQAMWATPTSDRRPDGGDGTGSASRESICLPSEVKVPEDGAR